MVRRKTRKAKQLRPGGAARPVALTRGPPKPATRGAAAPRLSNHKRRSVWFQARTAWPLREAPTAVLVHERGRTARTVPPAPGTAQWQLAGPTNIGGRMTSLVCDPANPDRVWAGAAGGGVWYSADAGRTWQPQWHDQDVLNVGALALDPTNPDIVYCGTGEANLSADSYAGLGIYRSTDGGKTWSLFASSSQTDIPRRIGVIAIDPFDSQHIRIGGVGYDEVGASPRDLGGMYTSFDGGSTWTRETFVLAQNYWCHAIVFHPATRGTILATFTARGPRSGIYRSTDGGTSWTQAVAGLPPPEQTGRTSLAISPSSPNVVYALAADQSSSYADRVLGVFRSRDGGTTWQDRTGSHFANERQMQYGNTIVVHPTKPNRVLCGGVDLHSSTNGGRTWRRATRWNVTRGAKTYAHADHHCLVMPASAAGRVYDANDGGLDVSEDGGTSWTNRSNGLAVTMFYDMDVAQSNPGVFGGGAQDNGTLVTTSGQRDDFFELLGGDGGWIVFDPHDAGHVYASYYNLNIYRFRGGGSLDVSPTSDPDEQGSVWMAYIDMDPGNSSVVFTGSRRVWRTRNDGSSWTPVSPALDGSPISAIEVAPASSTQVYVGTENGGLFRSTDGGNTWSANLAGSLPGYMITRLATSPADASLVYATMANFGRSHVFRSKDGGTTWEDVDRGRLPDVPHHAIAIPQSSPATIYVANDVGVFVSADGATTWKNLTRNLPHVMVVDLVYHEAAKTLTAATYGRSIWRLQV
ncbi:MAG: WD40/YVTN/BNR-like repeat-containing protein [Gemmatimonadales bacterium]